MGTYTGQKIVENTLVCRMKNDKKMDIRKEKQNTKYYKAKDIYIRYFMESNNIYQALNKNTPILYRWGMNCCLTKKLVLRKEI